MRARTNVECKLQSRSGIALERDAKHLSYMHLSYGRVDVALASFILWPTGVGPTVRPKDIL